MTRILVITPTLGSSPWLDETMSSVARFQPMCRHVLVTPSAQVEALAKRFPAATVVPEPGGGMYAAINAGLTVPVEWDGFTYINDDDLLLPRFARVVAGLRENPTGAVYGGVKLIGTKGQPLGAIPISPFPAMNRRLYAQRVEPVYQHGTLFSRHLYEKMGGFDDSFRFCGDTEYMARACVAGLPFRCATMRAVAAFRLRAGQLTKNLPVMQVESDRAHAKLSLPAPRLTWRHRWARLVFRSANLPVYFERVLRHGPITFGQLLARGE
ncbi:MAG: hypothetical protein QG602_2900 [Verrucomicrobiota bacterium]|nr:hypothetical protein [Verrucomicrobiota bacterium]